MMALVDRALALNPSFARGWYISGLLRLLGGPARSRDRAFRGFAASQPTRPRRPTSSIVIGAALFFSRRFDEAVPKLLLAIQDDPSFPTPYRYLAACYAHMGRLDEAREDRHAAARITPVVVPGAMLSRTPSIANSTCRACAWRPARRNEPDPPPRDPVGRYCGT